jgi:oligopeptidase B
MIMSTINPVSAQEQHDMSYPPQPPAAKKAPKVTEIHGDKLVDDYFWLREKQKPEVKAYLDSENAYTDAMMAHTKPLQGALYQELLSHIKETDQSAPYRDGEYQYYTRTEQGKQYVIFARRKSADAPNTTSTSVTCAPAKTARN